MKFGTIIHSKKNVDIEKIQKEAARIATGTTKLVSTEIFMGILDGKP